jgi:hypothetical protein
MLRIILASALVAGGISGIALADNGDSNIEQFEASQPHGQGVSNGIPVIVDNQGDNPVIKYQGAVAMHPSTEPVIIGNENGEPIIVYVPTEDAHTMTAEKPARNSTTGVD